MMEHLPRHIVGTVAMLIAAAIIGLLFWIELPNGNQDVALVILGVAIGWAGQVVSFHYGSSEGSKRKTEQLAEQAKKRSY